MNTYGSFRSGSAALAALAIVTGATAPMIAPLVAPAPAFAQAAFYDVADSYWAKDFIRELAARRVLGGFPDGSFKPDQPVTRAQFAAMLRQAFNRSSVRNPITFKDVPSNYWASGAIAEAYSEGWMSGYPEGDFRPEQNITRAQVIVALANGLNYSANSTNTALQSYNDASAIPDWARGSVAAATEKRMVVNYPNVNVLNPNQNATRAEVAAMLFQAMASTGQVAPIASSYIVGSQPVANTGPVQIPVGTALPTRYEGADKILLSFKEPRPVPVTLILDRNVITQSNRVLIPANTKIEGELRIIDDEGAQFFAKDMVLSDGTRLPLDATSRIVTKTESVRRGSNAIEILAGTAVGAAAAAGVAAVTGDRAIATEEVLGGGALGTLAGLFLGNNRVELISINPDTDLDLELIQALTVR
jgi:hypothetical protein